MSYPIDTVRRRMMMSSGEKTTYNSSLACAYGILEKEGIGSFFKGALANVIRGVAGAGVLAGFDVLKRSYIYYTRT
jgi:solute carrier family 25 (adenine nucleotide translocator) protein 4/5/6/31